ncbi:MULTISPECIES: hypothetical protein [unclassified Agreia]|nr:MULTISPECIES: hypothetical protein [unclassified Agreia]
MELSAIAASVIVIAAAWISLALAVGLGLGAVVRRRDAEPPLSRASDLR